MSDDPVPQTSERIIRVTNKDGQVIGFVTQCWIDMQTGIMDVSLSINILPHIERIQIGKIVGFELEYVYQAATPKIEWDIDANRPVSQEDPNAQ